MSWLRRRRGEEEIQPPKIDEARAAVRQSEREFGTVSRRWPEVRRTAGLLHRELQENHFAERFRHALGG